MYHIDLLCQHDKKDSSTVFSVKICNHCPCVAYPSGLEKSSADIQAAIAKVKTFQKDNDALYELGKRVLNDPSFRDEESIERDLATNLIKFNENLSSISKGLPVAGFDSKGVLHLENMIGFRDLLESLQWLVDYIDNLTK